MLQPYHAWTISKQRTDVARLTDPEGVKPMMWRDCHSLLKTPSGVTIHWKGFFMWNDTGWLSAGIDLIAAIAKKRILIKFPWWDLFFTWRLFTRITADAMLSVGMPFGGWIFDEENDQHRQAVSRWISADGRSSPSIRKDFYPPV